MDSEVTALETKCENLMNVVVETRKRFGKMCVEYEEKTYLMENKILNLQIGTFSNYKFKCKNPPTIDNQDAKDLEDFSVELVEMSKRFEDIQKKIKNTTEVVALIKADSVGKRLRDPLNADVILTKAKSNKS